jgi:tetratricopeptide (TPR) repeat protein
VLAIATYANATFNGFALDDGFLIAENPRITSLRNLPQFFTTDLFGGAYPGAMYYRPLVLTSFALEHAVVGSNPLLDHLTNTLLHALVCGLATLLALRLFGRESLALIAGAAFAVHPVHTEAVTAISGRGDLLGAVFVLTAGVLHARSGVRAGARRTAAILGCWSLALLSKESSIVALVLFPLVDLVRHEQRLNPLRAIGSLLRERAGLWLGLVLVAAAFLAIRQTFTASDVDASSLAFMGNRYALDASLSIKLATCAKLLGIYYRLLVFPVVLSADYDYNQIPLANGWLEATSLVPVLTTLALVAIALRGYRTRAPLFFGISFLLAGLLPLAFVLPFLQILLAERYLYLPSLGLCIALGGVVTLAPRARQRIVVAALVVPLVVLGAARSVVRNRDWRDDETLFAATVQAAPNSSKAQANYAAALAIRAEQERNAGDDELSRQLFRQAARRYERSIAIEPLAAPARAQYGLCLAALGRYESADAQLREAVRQGNAEALAYLYRILIDQSRQHAAAAPLRALHFHEQARELFHDQIRSRVAAEDAARLSAELASLERELRSALAAGDATPPGPGVSP